MRTISKARTRWKLPLGLGLALLAVAAVVVPTVAVARSDPRAAAVAGHARAGHHVTALYGVGLQTSSRRCDARRLASTTSRRRGPPVTSSVG